MKKTILFYFFILLYYLLYFVISLFIIRNNNHSIIIAFSIILILLFLIITIGNIISKIFFNFQINKKMIKKITYINSNKQNIKNSTIYSIIFLFIFYCIFYLFFYYNNNRILDLFPISIGVKNSCSYILKIFFISIPLYSFEITFLEYCKFLNSKKNILLLKYIKLLLYCLLEYYLLTNFYFNVFLYTKIAIDIFFGGYYIIKLRSIIKLCNLNLKKGDTYEKK